MADMTANESAGARGGGSWQNQVPEGTGQGVTALKKLAWGDRQVPSDLSSFQRHSRNLYFIYQERVSIICLAISLICEYLGLPRVL